MHRHHQYWLCSANEKKWAYLGKDETKASQDGNQNLIGWNRTIKDFFLMYTNLIENEKWKHEKLR